MNEELLAVVVDIGRMFMKSIPISLALAAVVTVLIQFWACNPGRPWWRKRDLVTDLCYSFFIPVVTRFFRIGLLVAGAAAFFHITTADGLIAFYENGHGPLAALPARRADADFPGRRGTSSPIGRTVFSTAGSCGSTTPCIIPPRSWNGSRPRVSIRSICSSAR